MAIVDNYIAGFYPAIITTENIFHYAVVPYNCYGSFEECRYKSFTRIIITGGDLIIIKNIKIVSNNDVEIRSSSIYYSDSSTIKLVGSCDYLLSRGEFKNVIDWDMSEMTSLESRMYIPKPRSYYTDMSYNMPTYSKFDQDISQWVKSNV